MRPEQIDLTYNLSAPAIHPDGTWAVVAHTRPDFTSDEYTGQLWRVALDGTCPPRRLTRGFRDTAPRFTPDGTGIVFLRANQGRKGQLHLVDARGGEPIQLTDMHLGVNSFDIAANSRTLVFTARVAEEGRYGTTDGITAAKEDPRHIQSLNFQANGLGYTADQRSHLFTLELPPLDSAVHIAGVGRVSTDIAPIPTAHQLTSGDVDDHSPLIVGSEVLFVAARHQHADSDLASGVYSVALSGGEITQLLPLGPVSVRSTTAALVSVGTQVYFLGGDLGASRRDFVAKNPGVYLLSSQQRLTDPDIEVVGISAANDGILALANCRGKQHLLRITNCESQVELAGEYLVTSAATCSNTLVAVAATPMTLPELGIVHNGTFTALTDFSAPLRTHTTITQPNEIVASASDGYPVHGWSFVPQGDGPHPVVLMIHGGPYASYHSAWFDEAQVFAAAGYAVLMCNPRGASGYGEAHGRVITGNFGDLDMTDILSFLDHCLATIPHLDHLRIGVQGGSYGGYMTAWIIGHTDRFRGAIVERGFLDPRSFVGAADIGWYFTHAYNTADPQRMDAQSPLLLTDKVHTPALIIHSEQDLRCPISAAFRYYTELKLAGVPTEMLVFPGENHELSRSGSPWHRRARFEAMLSWWRKYLSA